MINTLANKKMFILFHSIQNKNDYSFIISFQSPFHSNFYSIPYKIHFIQPNTTYLIMIIPNEIIILLLFNQSNSEIIITIAIPFHSHTIISDLKSKFFREH